MLFCAVLLWCSASAVVCSLYKFSSAKNSSQLALFCALCSVLCSQLPPYRSVSVCSTYYVQLLPSVEYQIHRMNASQAGRHTYTEAEGRQSQSAAAAQTQALTMYLYLCIFCIGVCICVSFIRYVRSVRFVGLFALCAQSRGNSTAQRTHTIKTHTRTRTTYVCIWPGRAFIVCVAEQKFCCSHYMNTRQQQQPERAHGQWRGICSVGGGEGGGCGYGQRQPALNMAACLPACLLGLPCAKRFAPNSHAVE